jgi:hypothetical protein
MEDARMGRRNLQLLGFAIMALSSTLLVRGGAWWCVSGV